MSGDGKAAAAASAAREGTVRHFMARWSKPADMSVEDFKAKQPDVSSAFREWLGTSGRFVYQLEKTVVRDPASGPALGGQWSALEQLAAGLGVNSHDNWHYQGYLYTKKKARPSALGRLLQQSGLAGIHLQPCSEAGVTALERYSMKADTRQAGPWADKRLREAYDPTSDVKTFDQLWTWQREVVTICEGAIDDRKINWVCNVNGCAGKTTLKKHLEESEKCDGFGMSHGTAHDLANLISKNQNHRTYMFDLPRTKPGSYYHSDIYAIMEGLKDGRLLNLKYVTESIKMRPAHVWVFANFLPDKSALTHDRLQVWQINGEGAAARLAPFDYDAYNAHVREQTVDREAKKIVAAADKKAIAAEAKERAKAIMDAKAALPVYDEKKDSARAYYREQDGAVLEQLGWGPAEEAAASAAVAAAAPFDPANEPGMHHSNVWDDSWFDEADAFFDEPSPQTSRFVDASASVSRKRGASAADLSDADD